MKILIIRRDNIGDLILTTPLIACIAQVYGTKVDVLVNTYNQSIMDNNPHIGRVHLYSKLHHRKPGQWASGVILRRLKTCIALRLARYDVAIIAREKWDKRPLQWAKLSGARRVIAIGSDAPAAITDLVPKPAERCHIVQLLAQLAKPIGVYKEPGPLELYITAEEIRSMKARLSVSENVPVYGLQISARKPMQRWQAEKFVEMADRLNKREKCHILLFWAPGKTSNKEHPGDDDKAQQIINALQDSFITPVATKNLRELMSAMSLCDQILTSDGGALHVAAGAGVPTVAMFGNSDALFWGPWGVPNETVEAPERNVGLLSVDEVYSRFIALRLRVVSQSQA
ncbi:glycosyltransferase family 9 protein [Erwiniaceae bacterium BAC15a-03b]|uniref:Glycosyltransferase family 9 protein n=1 Tax=Winslowiella arboricola TaxID=2978220 RepID=A0A9J6PP92_9GAMM|nr:glycosyltransferase family 9 protein [Winslowiella arboricola]MCU5774735.1 glycosyltransferase family 9 protein [Winslowiella arboricola]MCU5780113.1 glycosyltransferase family 9 protein [Winslowiella arboricola]